MIVPPDTTAEEFNLNWEEISSSVNAFPVEYALMAQGEELGTPLLPMICHRIKVQRWALLVVPLYQFKLVTIILLQAQNYAQWNRCNALERVCKEIEALPLPPLINFFITTKIIKLAIIFIVLFLRLLLELGYKLVPDTQSRAVSVIYLDDYSVAMGTEEGGAGEPE